MTAATALDVARLRDLVRPLDPMASVYVGVVPAAPTVDALTDFDLRLRRLAAALADQGAPGSTVDATVEHLVRLASRPAEFAVFVAGERVLFSHEMPGAPFDVARYGSPAHVLPLVAWLNAHPPYVQVVTDRTGAEVTAVPSGTLAGHVESVLGPDDDIERNAPGGWAQPRYQRRAEDSWRHNATAVAEAALRAVERVGARLLLISGDVRAVQLLRERLPERRLTVRLLTGGRTADGSEPNRVAAAAGERAAFAEERTAAVLAEFRDAARGIAVEGVEDTVAALASGRLRELLVAPAAAAGVAWFGPELMCALRPTGATGGPPPRQGPLPDVAVRAALLTGAHVHALDAEAAALADGIGGLCRYG